MAEVSKATALDKTFPVSVTNGNINIQFTGVVGRGIINAIKVEPSATTSTTTATATGPYYAEVGGLVSLEAEHGKIINRSGEQWIPSTNSWDYSGGGFLLPSPTSGTVFDPNYVGVAPEVQFQVNFQTTGTYAVWVRGAGTNVHAGLDGVAVATASDIGNFTADWGWSHTRMDGSFATLTVAAAGVHTVNVWMRDDAFWFDKIVLTQGAAPTGTGPAESAYVSGTSSTPAPAPAPNPVASSRPPFGVVHPPSNGCNSTIASAGFVQNWWDQGGSVSSLQSAVSAENNCGKMEVPLFFTSPNWNATQSQIASAMTSYFKGNPSIPYWQFGWEENIHGRCCSSTDLSTLYSELSGVAAGRSAAGVPQAQIAYQIVFGMGNPYNSTTVDLNSGGTLVQFQALLNSPAASLIDTLAIHPYAWNNYPTPETWQDQMLAQVRGYIAASPYANKNMQIIYTEAGAPVCDSSPTGCTLDEFGTPVRGQGQQENAEYMVKLHVMAYNAGVRNIVWYQQGFSPDPYCGPGTSGESCFGMSNSVGPRLVASAYRTMTECMTGKSATPKFTTVNGNVRVYEFPSLDGSSASCIVAWTYQNGVTEVVQPRNPAVSIPLSSITGKTVTSVQNTTGASIGFTAGGSLSLSPAPVFTLAASLCSRPGATDWQATPEPATLL